MNDSDLKYLDKLVTRFKGYKSPTDTQILLMMLAEKTNRNLQDNKDLKVLLTAEKKGEQLLKARTAARKLMNNAKEAERKKETRIKIIMSSILALEAKANVDPMMAQVMVKLSNSKFASEKDRQILKDDLEARILRGDFIMPVTTRTEPQVITDDMVSEPEDPLALSLRRIGDNLRRRRSSQDNSGF